MWQKLKSVFILEEEGGKSTTPKTSALPKRPAPATPPNTPPADQTLSVDADGGKGEVTDRFVKVLLEAMEKANQPGFDYLEYKKSLQNLGKMNFDEGTLYQTAYAAAQSMGVTPQALVASAEHYLKELGKEEGKFKTALGEQRKRQIGQRGDQLSKLEEEIKAMQAKIAAKQKKKTELETQIKNSTGKITATAANFGKTYELITGQISADLEKMKRYLK